MLQFGEERLSSAIFIFHVQSHSHFIYLPQPSTTFIYQIPRFLLINQSKSCQLLPLSLSWPVANAVAPIIRSRYRPPQSAALCLRKLAGSLHPIYMSIISLNLNTPFPRSIPSTPSGMRYARCAAAAWLSSAVSVTRTRPATLMDSTREGTVF